jgi:hypothetical protein
MRHSWLPIINLMAECSTCGIKLGVLSWTANPIDPWHPDNLACSGGKPVPRPTVPMNQPRITAPAPTPPPIKRCTCGAAAVGSNFHSSWC